LPELVAALAAIARLRAASRRCNGIALRSRPETSMTDPRLPDPNAELYAREPMRVVFALAALVLGLLAALH
jgi:hypothetical protein